MRHLRQLGPFIPSLRYSSPASLRHALMVERMFVSAQHPQRPPRAVAWRQQVSRVYTSGSPESWRAQCVAVSEGRCWHGSWRPDMNVDGSGKVALGYKWLHFGKCVMDGAWHGMRAISSNQL